MIARIAPALLLLVLLCAACGDGSGGADPTNPMAGVWKGEQMANDAQTPAEPLCMTVARSTPLSPGQFSGGMYLSGELIGIVAGTLRTDGTVSVITEVNIYEGARTGDQLSGTWGASAEEVITAGTWTLERTGDASCE